MPHVFLLVIAFLSGACVMMLEIVGSRLMGPYVGSSLHTWTALISVILGALSLGYFLGGKIADSHPTTRRLGIILFISGVLVASVKSIELFFFPVILPVIPDVRLQALIGGFILFGPANVLLGMVSPYVVRLLMTSVKQSGQSAGSAYAISTLGSIVGTIGSGFFLLPLLGHGVLLIIIAGLLFACAVVLMILNKQRSVVLILIGALGISVSSSFSILRAADADIDTTYNRVWIVHGTDENTQRPVVGLKTDPYAIQTLMFTDEDNEPASEYIKFFRLASAITSRLDRVLVVGGGGYSYPKDYLHTYPNGTIDVVELDPGITDIARKFFLLPEDSRLTIFHEDGRLFLNRTSNNYNAIFYDAFGQGLTPPFLFVTKEAFANVAKHLAPEGVFLCNLISALSGPNSELLQAVVTTMKQVFPHVSVFAVRDITDTHEVQNIILIAGMKPLSFPSVEDPQYGIYMTHQWKDQVPAGKILTDDYAPVEYLARNLYE